MDTFDKWLDDNGYTREEIPAVALAWVAQAETRMQALERENAELRRDAERYRWLRDADWSCHPEFLRIYTDSEWNARREALDAAIDAAIARPSGPESGC